MSMLVDEQHNPISTSMQAVNDLEEIKRRLKEVFHYYASFGDRLNVNNLKSSKFHKMMQDAGIYSGESLLEKKKLDILFC